MPNWIMIVETPIWVPLFQERKSSFPYAGQHAEVLMLRWRFFSPNIKAFVQIFFYYFSLTYNIV